LADRIPSDIYKTRGVFILNPYRFEKPNKRINPFHPNILKKAKSWNIVLIETHELYKIAKEKLKGKTIKNLEKRIFNTKEIFTFKSEDSG